MATIYWLGTAPKVAQVATAEFGTYDTSTTRTITINGVAVSAADSGGTLTAALSALATLLNASTHPYFAAITWSSNATKIIGTADVQGCPFTFVGSVSGGTGTLVNGYTVTTTNAGPNVWTTAANWSGGSVPVDTDTVIFKDNSIPVCWELAQSAVELTELRIDQTYTGKIGLSRDFAQAADGSSTVSTATEYRDQYLAIGATTTNIGQSFTASSAGGSGRLKLDFQTDAGTVVIHNTAASPSDTGQTAVQLKANNNTTDIFVRSAPGGVGLAIGPAETSEVRKISISDISTASKVYAGPGATIATWEQTGGTNTISPAATITTVTVNGGTLTIEGASAITTLNVYAGTVYSNTTGTITTATVNGTSATLDMTGSTRARAITTLNLTKGTFKADGSIITLTNSIADPSAKYSMTAA